MSIELKIKQKSLAEEARIIRLEKRKLKSLIRKNRTKYSYDTINSISNHNTNVVRVEARATHLARAFIKGVPYYVVESGRRDTKEYEFRNIILPKVLSMVKRYKFKGWMVTEEDISSWATYPKSMIFTMGLFAFG